MDFTTEPADASVGDRLRAARIAQGKSIADIAASIKIPARLLDAIERGAVDELPVGPYATGFTRNYAEALGLDGKAAAEDMRALSASRTVGTTSALSQYEPADPDRLPTRALAFTAAGVAGLLVVGYLVWKSLSFSPDSTEPAATAAATEPAAATVAATPAAPAAPAAPTIAIPADAPVLISASEQVWFSLEDGNGRGQFDLTLNAGEFYTVKPGQRSLFLRTGRPQALRIVVGDRRLPQLGPNDTVVGGVGLDAASLSRLASNPPGTTGATQAPAPTAPRTN
jgi:cytoskeleton protein RodZ